MRGTPSTRNIKRYKAKQLFQKNKYTQTQIAQMVGVNIKTVNEWVHRYSWKTDGEDLGAKPIVKALSGLISFGFRDYLKQRNPNLWDAIQTEIKSYMDATTGISQKQKSRLQKMVAKLAINEDRLNLLILELTESRATNVKTLSMEQADHLIKHLEGFDPDLLHEIVIKDLKQ